MSTAVGTQMVCLHSEEHTHNADSNTKMNGMAGNLSQQTSNLVEENALEKSGQNQSQSDTVKEEWSERFCFDAKLHVNFFSTKCWSCCCSALH